MKKFVLAIVVVLILVLSFGCTKKEKKINIGLMDFEEYKEIDPINVTSVEVAWYNEGGREDNVYEDETDILKIYNNLKNKVIVRKSEMACEDNTRIYIFKTDNKEYRVEIECNILIYNKDRYELE